jgi:hypothetical protein
MAAPAPKPKPEAFPLLEAFVGYFINKAIARGEEKTGSTGKILFNVCARLKDGSIKMLPPITENNVTVAFSDNIMLQPVVIAHLGNSPREIQFAVSNGLGVVRKIRYLAQDGGRRGRDGQAVDNGGYKVPPGFIPVTEIFELGVNGFHANWDGNRGVAQPSIIVRMDYIEMLKSLQGSEEMRQALAGAGSSTYPGVPVYTAIVDGQVKTFLSPDEVKAHIEAMNGLPGQRVGGGLPPQGGGSQPSSPSGTATTQLSMWRANFPPSYLDELKAMPVEQRYTVFRADIAREDAGITTLPSEMTFERGNGLAILLVSPKAFTAELVGPEGTRGRYTVRKTDKGYETIATIVPDPNRPADARLVVKENDRVIAEIRFK